MKFQRSNQNTCINQRPLVNVGDQVKKGDIIADGPSTDLGELALGRNVLVAFMPWNGYNFEDSILLSERIVKDDVFTSIHIEEFEVMARDTKLGPGGNHPRHPERRGRGAEEPRRSRHRLYRRRSAAGDILVGKITPKGESPMTPEEKLLRAIFGEKASDVRDTSLRVPPGVQGTVVEVRVFNRHGVDKDERALPSSAKKSSASPRTATTSRRSSTATSMAVCAELLDGRQRHRGPEGLQEGHQDHQGGARRVSALAVVAVRLAERQADGRDRGLRKQYDESKKLLEQRFLDKVEKLQRGDELPPGVMKMVKVFVAVKRKIQPGDKMAGRHGNKGVVSKIVPVGGHAVPRRRHAGRHRAQSARRAEPHERRPDSRDPSGLGLRRPRPARSAQAVDVYNSKHDTQAAQGHR